MRFSLKYLFCFMFILTIYWIIASIFRSHNCSSDETITLIELNKKSESNIYFSPELGEPNGNKKKIFLYNRFLPLVFVAGVPGSGLGLLCKLLDEDINIRCSDNFGLVSEMIFRHDEWTNSKIEKERLLHASMTDNVIDGAVIAFILDLILKQGKVAPRICNKDNRIMNHAKYMKKLFPNIKFLFMVRDARPTSNTIVKKRILINGAKMNNHKDALIGWNKMMDKMYTNCADIGFDTCLPIYYEKLLLEPEKTMTQIFKFVNFNHSHTVTSENKVLIDKHKLYSWNGQFPSDLTSQLTELAPYFNKLGYDAKSLNNYSYLFRNSLIS